MPPQAQGNQNDNSLAMLWMMAAIFIFGGVIWVTFKAEIVSTFLKLKLWEISFLSLFTSHLEETRSTIFAANPAQLSFQETVNIGDKVGSYLRYPLGAILVVSAGVLYFGNKVKDFRHTYSMKKLAEAERMNWPQITPITKLDLINEDINKGPWAMAMTPMQFCKRNGLLQEHTVGRKEGVLSKEADKITVTLKRGEANKLFALQVGPLWHGVAKLPPHIKALYAIFAARLNNDGKLSATLLAKISASANTKLDFYGTEEICQKYTQTPIVQSIVSKHAYIYTVLSTMLQEARRDGVLASADFLWLKPVDRRLWYVLNSIGRQTPFIESAGAYAHWLAEVEMGKKIITPMVEEATAALELSLKDTLYNPHSES